MAAGTPYLIALERGLEAGGQVVVRGALVGNEFSINLSSGPDMVYQKPTGDDVALHLMYSRGSRRIILNSFQSGAWGPEEFCDGSVIQEQVPFEIRIVVQSDRLEIILNNVKLADFFHRLPLPTVRALYIVGDIGLILVDAGAPSRPPRATTVAGVHALEKVDPSALTPGNAIVVRGAPAGATFSINLSTGPDMVDQKGTGDDIALHVSYSGGARRLVMNSFRAGQWEQELQCDAQSINQGVPFEIRIIPQGDRFGIVVNNQKLAEFPYRLPLHLVQFVYIVGDINFQGMNFAGQSTLPPQPAPAPGPGPGPTPDPFPVPTPGPGPAPLPTPGPGPDPSPASVLPVPYRHKLQQPFSPGHKLIIVGTPTGDANQFHVNLYASHLNAFHNLANFVEKVVIRDSRSTGEDWDKKVENDSNSGFPYVPGKQFELVYAAEESAFQIYVDGVHHFTFNHRVPPNKINALGIEGDLTLQAVKFE